QDQYGLISPGKYVLAVFTGNDTGSGAGIEIPSGREQGKDQDSRGGSPDKGNRRSRSSAGKPVEDPCQASPFFIFGQFGTIFLLVTEVPRFYPRCFLFRTVTFLVSFQ